VLNRPGDREQLLSPQAPLDSLNTQLTSRCNLRCLYCPQGKGITDDSTDMPRELLDQLIEFVAAQKIPAVGFGYFGETSLYKGWEDSCEKLLDAGARLSLTANFATQLSGRALEVLSRFSYIEMSIDSVNGRLLRDLRPPADARTIVYNLHMIRAKAMARGSTPPFICWPCVLTNKAVPDLCDLVLVAASCWVNRLQLNEMYRFDGTPPEIQNILELPDQAFLEAWEAIRQAVALGAKHDLPVCVAGQEKYEARAEAIRRQAAGSAAPTRLRRTRIQGIQGPSDHFYLEPTPSAGQTRMCLYPWTTAYVAATGDVFACCARGEVMGNVGREGGLDSVLANSRYRDLRRQLLTGDIQDPICRVCTMAPAAPVADLVNRVRRRLGRETWIDRLRRRLRKFAVAAARLAKGAAGV
jgi:MoaA/NifB/PqqE/SkfB family radical SAM enzyme